MMECVPSANPGRRVGASLTRHHTALPPPPPHLCNDANWTGVLRLLRTGLRGRSISAAAAAAAFQRQYCVIVFNCSSGGGCGGSS